MSTRLKKNQSSSKKVIRQIKPPFNRREYSHVPVNHLDFNKKRSKSFTSG